LCIVFSIIDFVFCIFDFVLGHKDFGCKDGAINSEEEKEEALSAYEHCLRRSIWL